MTRKLLVILPLEKFHEFATKLPKATRHWGSEEFEVGPQHYSIPGSTEIGLEIWETGTAKGGLENSPPDMKRQNLTTVAIAGSGFEDYVDRAEGRMPKARPDPVEVCLKGLLESMEDWNLILLAMDAESSAEATAGVDEAIGKARQFYRKHYLSTTELIIFSRKKRLHSKGGSRFPSGGGSAD